MTPADRVRRLGWRVTHNGCWEFNGARTAAGYGQINYEHKRIYAHRIMLEEQGVDINGLVVAHSCDNPSCVNPAHLSAVTQSDNVNDMVAKGRAGYKIGDLCPKGHVWEENNIYTLPSTGAKLCRECRRLTHERYRIKMRAKKQQS